MKRMLHGHNAVNKWRPGSRPVMDAIEEVVDQCAQEIAKTKCDCGGGHSTGHWNGCSTKPAVNPTPPIDRDNSLDAFFAAVRSSVDGHAARKNYTDNGPDGHNRMVTVMREMGIHRDHCIGEIVYKCAEYLRAPRRVLLEKVAGWAFVLWRETKPDAQ